MTDFHSHVLPGIDDGSKDVGMSIGMLDMMQAQGVSRLCCTSHFYANRNTPENFLRNRQAAYEKLTEEMEKERQKGKAFPELRLGAEVHFFDGMSTSKDLPDLCLEGTNLLLLEMPFTQWSDRMLDEVVQIGRRGLQPVAAHIERYLNLNSKRTIKAFMEETGVLIQCNAEFFLDRRTARKALHMLKKEQIHFLGSDAHNLTLRQPNFRPAADLIERKLGPYAMERLLDIAEDLIGPEREALV
jgi:protein-tyrosine phosphatase